MMISKKTFAGFLVITVADLFQFPGVKGKPFQFSDKGSM